VDHGTHAAALDDLQLGLRKELSERLRPFDGDGRRRLA